MTLSNSLMNSSIIISRIYDALAYFYIRCPNFSADNYFK